MTEKVTFNVKRVTVLINNPGTDQVSLELDCESPFPSMGYSAHATIHVQKGLGPDWCRRVVGLEPTIIDARTGKGT